MKANIITFLLTITLCCGISYAQSINTPVAVNPNDTTFTRVYNGIVVNNNFKIKGFNSIKTITDYNEINKLGLKRGPIMIIEDNKTDFEYQIENQLFTKKASLIKNLDYPLIKRPIAVNGKLIPKAELSSINFNQIKSIRFSQRKIVDGQDTPFGCIDISM